MASLDPEDSPSTAINAWAPCTVEGRGSRFALTPTLASQIQSGGCFSLAVKTARGRRGGKRQNAAPYSSFSQPIWWTECWTNSIPRNGIDALPRAALTPGWSTGRTTERFENAGAELGQPIGHRAGGFDQAQREQQLNSSS